MTWRVITKRLVKTPKLYFYDTGQLCWALGIRSPQQLETHPLRGAIFECWVVSEIMKHHTHRGVTPRFSFFRDQKGHECDLVIEQGDRVMAVEIKSGQTVASDVSAAMSRVVEDPRAAPGGPITVAPVVVYGGCESVRRSAARQRSLRDRRRTRPAGTYNPLRTSMRRVTAADTIALDEIRDLARTRFGDMIKGVVDLERGIMLLDADLHADQEATLLADGSKQANLWGINLYPDVAGDDWLEFDSMINLRPSVGNRSRSVDDAGTRVAIAAFIARVVRR